ncbi:MAG TPA: WD40 repeat domain-containing protein, partial [Candidatus Babeliales bacterium]|nr:WD40 repeat domain-containing protein [Candidatus Babeliales bacterium]
MKVSKIVLSVAMISAICIPHVLYPALSGAEVKEDAAARAQLAEQRSAVARQRELEAWQQAEADRLKREGGARAVAAQEAQGLEEDDEELQRVLAESLKPKRLVKPQEEEKEEDEKVHSEAWLQHREDFNRWENEDKAVRERRGSPVKHSDADVRKLIGSTAVPRAVSEHMESFILKKDAEVISTLIQTERPITCLGISSDSKSICGASENGAVYVWDAITEKLIHKFDSGIKKPLAISGDGKIIIAADALSHILIWNVDTKASNRIDDVYLAGGLSNIAITAKGEFVIERALGKIRSFYASTGREYDTFAVDRWTMGGGIATNTNGSFVGIGSGHYVHIYDTELHRLVNSVYIGEAQTFALAADASFIVSQSPYGLDIWNAKDGGLIINSPNLPVTGWQTEAIVIDGGNNFIVAAYKAGIRIWRLVSSIANVAYARRGHAVDEAEKLRDQAKAVRKFPANRLRAINKGVALLKSADMTRKDFEAYIGKIKNRINKEFQEGRDEAVV